MNNKKVSIILEGVEYTSELEAARAYNTSMYSVKNRIERGWTLEQAYDIKPSYEINKGYISVTIPEFPSDTDVITVDVVEVVNL